MGMNVDTNEFERLKSMEGIEKLTRRFNERLEGLSDKAEAETRKAAGPPVFEEGEVLTIKGYDFRVSHIGQRKMILRPVKLGQ